jgi:hypothetical protein
MYIATLVDDIVKVLSKLESNSGTEFSFAMLYSRSESADFGWNLIVAATWIDRDRRAATPLITRALKDELGLENKLAIARITALETRDPFVLEAVFYAGRVGLAHPMSIRNVTFAGVPVVNGLILRSSPNQ